MTQRFKQEFPDFGEMDVEIPSDFEDQSWHNESCPCFHSETAQAFLWVDYEDPARREYEGALGFTLSVSIDGQVPDDAREPLCSTDDWAAMLKAIDARRAEMAARPTA